MLNFCLEYMVSLQNVLDSKLHILGGNHLNFRISIRPALVVEMTTLKTWYFKFLFRGATLKFDFNSDLCSGIFNLFRSIVYMRRLWQRYAKNE